MPTFRPGDMVRIKAGPFQSFTGRIDGINQARLLLKIKVNIYGRTKAAKLKFSEVEKVEFADGISGTKQ